MSFLTFIIAAMINIIPAPAQLQEQDGCFQLDVKSTIKADCPELTEVEMRRPEGEFRPIEINI